MFLIIPPKQFTFSTELTDFYTCVLSSLNLHRIPWGKGGVGEVGEVKGGESTHGCELKRISSTERGVMEELQLSWKRLGGAMWSGTSLFCCWRSHGKVELRPPSPLPPIQPSRAPAPVSYYKMAAEAPPLLRTDWTLHGRIYHRVREVYRDGDVPCRVFVSCWGGKVASFDSKHGSWESKYFQLSPLWHQCCLLRECCLTPLFVYIAFVECTLELILTSSAVAEVSTEVFFIVCS